VLPSGRRGNEPLAEGETPTVPKALLRRVSLAEKRGDEHVTGKVHSGNPSARAAEHEPASRLGGKLACLSVGDPHLSFPFEAVVSFQVSFYRVSTEKSSLRSDLTGCA
jgi:hypothetical protein